MLSNACLLLSATPGPNQAVSERANVSRGRHHTYCTQLQTDTTSCSGFTVAAKGQREEEQGGCMEREYGTERKRKEKRTAVEKRRRKREDEMGGRGWQEGSIQIAQDLTGIFLDG